MRQRRAFGPVSRSIERGRQDGQGRYEDKKGGGKMRRKESEEAYVPEVRWEYRISELSTGLVAGVKVRKTEPMLNELGDQGWELVAVYAMPRSGGWAFFKRKKIEEAAA